MGRMEQRTTSSPIIYTKKKVKRAQSSDDVGTLNKYFRAEKRRLEINCHETRKEKLNLKKSRKRKLK